MATNMESIIEFRDEDGKDVLFEVHDVGHHNFVVAIEDTTCYLSEEQFYNLRDFINTVSFNPPQEQTKNI